MSNSFRSEPRTLTTDAQDGTQGLLYDYLKPGQFARIFQIVTIDQAYPIDDQEFWEDLMYKRWTDIAQEAANSYIAYPSKYEDDHTDPLLQAMKRKINSLYTRAYTGRVNSNREAKEITPYIRGVATTRDDRRVHNVLGI